MRPPLKSAEFPPHLRAQLERAVLNLAYMQGITSRGLLAPLKRCGVVVSAQQSQQFLDQLVEEGKLFTTRSMKQTQYHTVVARSAGHVEINVSLLGRIIALLGRLQKSETAQRVAHLLNISQAAAASHLDYASVQGDIQSRNVGKLRLYSV